MEGSSFFQRLKRGLSRSREEWAQKLGAICQSRRWDEQTIEAVEETLIAADIGMKATQQLIEALRRQAPKGSEDLRADLSANLQQLIIGMLRPSNEGSKIPFLSLSPWVMLFLGVNGAGKTTTIGKLASKFRADGKKVLLVAADTFRAAAIEQLEIWGQRVDAEVVKHRPGADPSAVVYDGIQAAKKRGSDVVLIDTAGRLHTKIHLIEELRKIRRVIAREQPGAPHDTLLVLDATTGQNGLQQARVFEESLDITGIVLTKLDGTAKGGVVVSIQEELSIPVEYIGVGEDIDDLQRFDPVRFTQALFEA